jgi:hypothetical protein
MIDLDSCLESRFGLPGFRLDQNGRIAQGAMNEYA